MCGTHVLVVNMPSTVSARIFLDSVQLNNIENQSAGLANRHQVCLPVL